MHRSLSTPAHLWFLDLDLRRGPIVIVIVHRYIRCGSFSRAGQRTLEEELRERTIRRRRREWMICEFHGGHLYPAPLRRISQSHA